MDDDERETSQGMKWELVRVNEFPLLHGMNNQWFRVASARTLVCRVAPNR